MNKKRVRKKKCGAPPPEAWPSGVARLDLYCQQPEGHTDMHQNKIKAWILPGDQMHPAFFRPLGRDH
jgi:hypothetical protein